MIKLLRISLAGLLLIFSHVSFASAQNTQDEMMVYNFYSDLAVALERNMYNPEKAVNEVNEIVKDFGPKIKRLMEKGKRMTQANTYTRMSEAEMQRELNQPRVKMQLDKQMQAAQRYIQALQVFSQKHPKAALKIADAFEELGLMMKN